MRRKDGKLKKVGTKLTEKEVKRIEQLYHEYKTDDEIAKILNRSHNTVAKITNKLLYKQSPKLLEF